MGFKQNVCKVIGGVDQDIIKLKSYIAFPEYFAVYQNKIFYGAKKTYIVYWLKVMQVKFVQEKIEMLFGYKYDDEWFHQVQFKICISVRQEQKKRNDAYKSIGSVIRYLLNFCRKIYSRSAQFFQKLYKVKCFYLEVIVSIFKPKEVSLFITKMYKSILSISIEKNYTRSTQLFQKFGS